MQFLPLGYHTYFDSPTDYERVTYDPEALERRHRRTIRELRRRRT